MADSNKVKAAIAGTAAVALVAAASVQQQESTGYSQSVLELQEAVAELTDTARDRGMTLPDSPGINDIVEGLDGMAPSKGEDWNAIRVCGSEAVSTGDPVRVSAAFYGNYEGTKRTYTTHTAANVLCAASEAEDRTNSGWDETTVRHEADIDAIVYTSGGNTYVAARRLTRTGKTTMPFLQLCTGEATCADAVMDYQGDLLVAYELGGQGLVTYATVDSAGIAKKVTCTWAAGGDPANIKICYDHFYARAAICCTRLDAQGNRCGALVDLDVTPTAIALTGAEAPLTEAACPALAGLSIDAAADGWDICYAASAYRHGQYDDDPAATRGWDDELSVALVTCPRSGGGQAVIWCERDKHTTSQVKGYTLSGQRGSSGGAAMEDILTGQEISTTMLAQAMTNGTEHYIGVELYWLRASDSATECIYRGRIPGSEALGAASQVRICGCAWLGSATLYDWAMAAVSWVADNTLYAATVQLTPALEVIVGPAVKVMDLGAGCYGTVAEGYPGSPRVIWQDSAGACNMQITGLTYAASPADAEHADGVALSGGAPGETINIYRYTEEDET